MLQLERKLNEKTAVIGIIGLGYVGLPSAVGFAEAGLKVIGFDVQVKKVEAVNRGESYIGDLSSQALSAVVTSGQLQATTDQSHIADVDALCICVPTPLNKRKEPDLSYVIHECEEISKHPRRGQLIVLESTTYPGTTREVVLPILERSGLRVGHDFYLAYSPERIDPGNKSYDVKTIPKLMGGIDSESARLGALLYRHVANTVITVSSPEAAEMTKIFENVFRNINIALVNELALLCKYMGISVWEIIDAASSKPFGFMPFYPGPGVGGHCIPLDPYYLASKAKEYDFHTRFIELAAEINEQMPYRVTSDIIDIMNAHGKSIKGAKVLVLGATFKKDVDDIRESPSLKIIPLLREKGAEVLYNDPYIPEIRIGQDTLASVELSRECLSEADCTVIAADHSCYEYQYIIDNANIVFDTRGVTRTMKGKNIIRLGESINAHGVSRTVRE